MLGSLLRAIMPTKFQSAPGREAGRCHHEWIASRMAEEFQSAPGREAGRCAQTDHLITKTRDVSIRARP